MQTGNSAAGRASQLNTTMEQLMPGVGPLTKKGGDDKDTSKTSFLSKLKPSAIREKIRGEDSKQEIAGKEFRRNLNFRRAITQTPSASRRQVNEFKSERMEKHIFKTLNALKQVNPDQQTLADEVNKILIENAKSPLQDPMITNAINHMAANGELNADEAMRVIENLGNLPNRAFENGFRPLLQPAAHSASRQLSNPPLNHLVSLLKTTSPDAAHVNSDLSQLATLEQKFGDPKPDFASFVSGLSPSEAKTAIDNLGMVSDTRIKDGLSRELKPLATSATSQLSVPHYQNLMAELESTNPDAANLTAETTALANLRSNYGLPTIDVAGMVANMSAQEAADALKNVGKISTPLVRFQFATALREQAHAVTSQAATQSLANMRALPANVHNLDWSISAGGAGGVVFVKDPNQPNADPIVLKFETGRGIQESEKVNTLIGHLRQNGNSALPFSIVNHERRDLSNDAGLIGAVKTKLSNVRADLDQQFTANSDDKTIAIKRDKVAGWFDAKTGKFQKGLLPNFERSSAVSQYDFAHFTELTEVSFQERKELIADSGFARKIGETAVISTLLGMKDHLGLAGDNNWANLCIGEDGGFVAVDLNFGRSATYGSEFVEKRITEVADLINTLNDASAVSDLLGESVFQTDNGIGYDGLFKNILAMTFSNSSEENLFCGASDSEMEQLDIGTQRTFLANLLVGVADGLKYISENEAEVKDAFTAVSNLPTFNDKPTAGVPDFDDKMAAHNGEMRMSDTQVDQLAGLFDNLDTGSLGLLKNFADQHPITV